MQYNFNACLNKNIGFLSFLRCSPGRLFRWMLLSLHLSMRSNRSLSAKADISTVLRSNLDFDFRGRPCTPRTGMGTFTTTTPPPRRTVRQNHQTGQQVKILPPTPDCLVPLTTVSRRGIPESCLSNKLSRFNHHHMIVLSKNASLVSG